MNSVHILCSSLARQAAGQEIALNPSDCQEARELLKAAHALKGADLWHHLEEISYNGEKGACDAARFTFSVCQMVSTNAVAVEALMTIYGELSRIPLGDRLFTGVKPLMFSKFRKLAFAQEAELKEFGAHLIPEAKAEALAEGDEWGAKDEEDYISCRSSFMEYCSFGKTERGSAYPSAQMFFRLLSAVSPFPGSGVQEWRPKK